MAPTTVAIQIKINIYLPLWDAIKLRIAGGRATEVVVREILARIVEPQPPPAAPAQSIAPVAPEAPHA